MVGQEGAKSNQVVEVLGDWEKPLTVAGLAQAQALRLLDRSTPPCVVPREADTP